MTGSDVFEVRFHAGGANWPANPFRFRGKGQLAIEPDFVLVRGGSHRSFRFPVRQEHRLRKVDIVNVRLDGRDLRFDVLGVRETLTVGFSAADAQAARQIAALLPARQTEEFAVAHGEREEFYDRIDYWSPSTPVTWTLLALNIGIFLLMWWQRQGVIDPAGVFESLQLVGWGSNVGRLTLGGEWWRLFTSMFLHGSLLHLGFNMVVLYQAGQLAERIFGSLRFTGLYLIAGLCGSLGSVLWNPHVNSVGASGALFGLVGGLLAFIHREHSGVPPTVVKDLQGSLLPFLLFNIVAGFIYPHTDNAAHIGGLAGGWLAGHLLARSLHVPSQRAA
jgi:membrane associated rhomboid family serine protease